MLREVTAFRKSCATVPRNWVMFRVRLARPDAAARCGAEEEFPIPDQPASLACRAAPRAMATAGRASVGHERLAIGRANEEHADFMKGARSLVWCDLLLCLLPLLLVGLAVTVGVDRTLTGVSS
jgi:hypothetical protein